MQSQLLKKEGATQLALPGIKSPARTKPRRYTHGNLPSFEQFVQHYGGFDKLLGDMGDTDGHYVEWCSMENPEFDNLSQAEQDKIVQETAYKDLEQRYDEAVSQYESSEFPCELYREVSLEGGIKSLKLSGIGPYWAWDERKAEAHWGHFGQDYEQIMLRALVPESAVDWESTLLANIDPRTGEEEAEVRLIEGARFELTGWRKRGEREWRVPPARWVTASAAKTASDPASEYPVAGSVVDGLTVRDMIPNLGSIDSSLTGYEKLRRIRVVPMAGLDSAPRDLFYAADDIRRCERLAEQIRESGEVNPLIVVVDEEGPYILEGAHRLGALHILGKKEFPALVVLDLESLSETKTAVSKKAFIPNDVIYLKNYLTMNKRDMGEELARAFPSEFWEFLERTNPDVQESLRSQYEDYEYIDDFSSIPDGVLTEFLEDCGTDILNKDPVYAPLFLHASYEGLVKNQWLIHFTDDAFSISSKGFTRGVDNMAHLGLTTNFSENVKKNGGYNFAYLLNDFERYAFEGRGGGRPRYGSECVIFRASGVKIYHYGDNEPQVIFWGKDARDIIPITRDGNDEWVLPTDDHGKPVYKNEDLDNVVNWVVNNFEQYRSVLLTNKDGKPKPPKAKAAAYTGPSEAAMKTLREIEPRAGDGFKDWLLELVGDDQEFAQAWADDDLRLDYLDDYLRDEYQIDVREDGACTFWKATPEVEHLIGDLPVIVYHHTSSGLLPAIRREGLRADARKSNSYQNSGAGVYVTTEVSGPAVEGYKRNAISRRKGHPVTLEIKTTLNQLTPDPDDEDIASGEVQFILPYVPPQDIEFPKPERKRKASGKKAGWRLPKGYEPTAERPENLKWMWTPKLGPVLFQHGSAAYDDPKLHADVLAANRITPYGKQFDSTHRGDIAFNPYRKVIRVYSYGPPADDEIFDDVVSLLREKYDLDEWKVETPMTRAASAESKDEELEFTPWIGVDLDATLAYTIPGNDYSDPTKIGDPIPKMVEKVKLALSHGENVKVFTARMADKEHAKEIQQAIGDWTEKHLGQRLEATNEKDPGMVEIWDDKARSVEPDTGRFNVADIQILASREKPVKIADHHNEDGFWVGEGGAASGILPICRSTKRIGLAWRSSEVNQGDCWGTIGGAVQKDMEPAESAKAELAEETGYNGAVELHQAYVFRSGSFRYFNFIGVVGEEFGLHPEPGHGWETDSIEWVSLDDLRSDMSQNPDDYHPGLIALVKNSGSLIERLCGGDDEPEGGNKVAAQGEPDWIQNLNSPASGVKVMYTRETYDGWFAITINRIPNPSCLTLFLNGKAIGRMFTDTFNRKGKSYMRIRSVEIPARVRGKGLGKEMYKVLLATTDTEGIISYLPDRSNKKQVPGIYRSLGGRVEDGDWAIIPKTASPDFGYSHYNNRETDLAALRWQEISGGHGTCEISAFTPDSEVSVGTIGIGPCKNGNGFWVIGIEISPDWRGSGLGQMLYDRAIRKAKELGAQRFYAGARSDDAKRAWDRLAKRYPVKVDEETRGKTPYVDLQEVKVAALSNVAGSFPAFNTFVRRHGGLRALMEEYDGGHSDMWGGETKKEQVTTAKKDLADRYRDLTTRFSALQFPCDVYRLVGLPGGIETLSREDAGVYWSWSEKGATAEPHWSNGANTVLLHGKIGRDAVDWDETLRLDLDPWVKEDECRLLPGAHIDMVAWRYLENEGWRSESMALTAALSKNPALKPDDNYLEGSNGWALFPDQRKGAYDEMPVATMVPPKAEDDLTPEENWLQNV